MTKPLTSYLDFADTYSMVAQSHEIVRDPYRRCEERCRHDLGRGLSLAELFGTEEAPTRPSWTTSLPAAPRRIPLYTNP